MYTLFLTLLVAIIPNESVISNYVDVVEINHFYDDKGRLVFRQVIWYDWSNLHNRHEIVAWRLVKDESILPVKGVSLWLDVLKWRRVQAKSIRETWTQYDPELVERESLPKEKRRGLSCH